MARGLRLTGLTGVVGYTDHRDDEKIIEKMQANTKKYREKKKRESKKKREKIKRKSAGNQILISHG